MSRARGCCAYLALTFSTLLSSQASGAHRSVTFVSVWGNSTYFSEVRFPVSNPCFRDSLWCVWLPQVTFVSLRQTRLTLVILSLRCQIRFLSSTSVSCVASIFFEATRPTLVILGFGCQIRSRFPTIDLSSPTLLLRTPCCSDRARNDPGWIIVGWCASCWRLGLLYSSDSCESSVSGIPLLRGFLTRSSRWTRSRAHINRIFISVEFGRWLASVSLCVPPPRLDR